jgi:hypothetical protein
MVTHTAPKLLLKPQENGGSFKTLPEKLVDDDINGVAQKSNLASSLSAISGDISSSSVGWIL